MSQCKALSHIRVLSELYNYCPFDLSFISRSYRCTDKKLKQHTGVTEMVLVHRYLTQLCTSLPRQKKRDINPVLDYCWASVADDGFIMNRHWINVSCLL